MQMDDKTFQAALLETQVFYNVVCLRKTANDG